MKILFLVKLIKICFSFFPETNVLFGFCFLELFFKTVFENINNAISMLLLSEFNIFCI